MGVGVSLSNPKTGSCSNTTSLWRLLVLPTLQTQPAAEVAKSLKFCQCEEAAVHESPYTNWSSVDHLDHLERSSKSYFNIISISQPDMIIYDYYDTMHISFSPAFMNIIPGNQEAYISVDTSRILDPCPDSDGLSDVKLSAFYRFVTVNSGHLRYSGIFVWVFWWIFLQCPLFNKLFTNLINLLVLLYAQGLGRSKLRDAA